MKHHILSAVLLSCILHYTAFAEPTVIFFDDFNSEASYHTELTQNATNKVYVDNSLPAGHLLKLWNYSWEYDYHTKDWRQAFYVVAPGTDYMTQAGRSGAFRGMAPYRITAKAKIPPTAKRYRIELKQYKHDNDPVFYLLGADPDGFNGIELGYENQLPGTDHTVDDAYIRGSVAQGLILKDRAHRRTWTEVTLDVDVESKIIAWTMAGDPFLTVHARDLRPGGHFGIYMRYERSTRFDDVKITVLQ